MKSHPQRERQGYALELMKEYLSVRQAEVDGLLRCEVGEGFFQT